MAWFLTNPQNPAKLLLNPKELKAPLIPRDSEASTDTECPKRLGASHACALHQDTTLGC